MRRITLVVVLIIALGISVQPVFACSGPDCNPPPPPPPGAIAISPNVACVPVAHGHYFYIFTGQEVKTTPVIRGACP